MEIEQIAKLLSAISSLSNTDENNKEKISNFENPNIGNWVIVRARDAGVHFGKLESVNNGSAFLSSFRRLWRWHAADEMSVSGVARHGINGDKSKIAGVSPGILEVAQYCEIIPCTEKCINSINLAGGLQ